ncbi:MAG: VWA domain-containing protein [Gammaproteobacteria bacterium]|nr:VWA domain-containing protein [Gammaproteobacteria bacterium]
MLVEFFHKLRKADIPVSLTEYLVFLDALDHRVAGFMVDDFYYLGRACLVKDERHYDRYDLVFGGHFKGMQELFDTVMGEVPDDWLEKQAELLLGEAEKRRIEILGGWDALMTTLKQRLAEQSERHQGGSKWIGTAGTSPFGAYGYNPQGVRIGQEDSRHQSAVKVWDRREYKNLDDTVELGTRNLKLALRKLRRFAREGANEELDLDDTVRSTARQGGLLDIRMVPERHNAVKVLLFLDIGGSMNQHVAVCEELFSAARSEFKHLEYFYFHNFIYEGVWRDNRRRHTEKLSLIELMRTFGKDHKLVFVGDASMSPYEIAVPGGSVEHWNEEAGAVWAQRLLTVYDHAVWLNPIPESHWNWTQSVRMVREIIADRMYPLTLAGLERAIASLKHRH